MRVIQGRRWLRPAVDATMTVALLLQMVPGKTGNQLHEATGAVFVALFVLHHALNWGWWRRLGKRAGLRSRCALLSDVLLTACVVGTALTGILMSRSLMPALAVAGVAHVVRPLHGALAYAGLMACAFHVGLHVRVLRGYLGKRGRVQVPWVQPLVAVAIGIWASARLGVAGKLLGQPSFPDGMTPLVAQVLLHLALCLPFVVVGSMVDMNEQGGASHE